MIKRETNIEINTKDRQAIEKFCDDLLYLYDKGLDGEEITDIIVAVHQYLISKDNFSSKTIKVWEYDGFFETIKDWEYDGFFEKDNIQGKENKNGKME